MATMGTPASVKRKVLSLQEKLGVLQAVEDKVPTAVILEQFGIAMSTFHRIKAQERDLKQKATTAKNLHCKRAKKSPYEQLNKALTEWYLERRLANDIIGGPTVKNKAKELALSMGIDFVPSNGWLQRWKEKEKVSFHTPKGKKVSPNATEAHNWINHVLSPILNEYDQQNIYCADETAVFYAADDPSPPHQRHLCWKLGFLCNRDGADKQAFLEELKASRENVKNVSDKIRKDKWTIGERWSMLLQQLNHKLAEARRHIVLFADVNALPIKASEPLTHIRCVYFPRNIKSLVNPLRQGVIQHVKTQYLQQLTKRRTASLEAGESVSDFCQKMAHPSAEEMLQGAVTALEPETVQRCFRKAGFESGTSDKPVELVVDADCPALTRAEFEEWMAEKQEAPREGSVSKPGGVAPVKADPDQPTTPRTEQEPPPAARRLCLRKAGFEVATSDKPVDLVVDADCPALTRAEFEEWMAAKPKAPRERSVSKPDGGAQVKADPQEPTTPPSEQAPPPAARPCPERKDVIAALKTLREFYEHVIADHTKFHAVEAQVLSQIQKDM